MSQIVQMIILVGGIVFLGVAFLVGFWLYLTQFKCRKIKVPLYELKRDGSIKKVGMDVIKEKKLLPKGKIWVGKKSKGVWLKPEPELIDVYKQKGKAVEALPIFEQVMTDCKNLLPNGYIETPHFMTTYGRCLTSLKRYDEAEEILLKAYNLEIKMRNANHLRVKRCVQSLITLFEAWGREEQAKQWRKKL